MKHFKTRIILFLLIAIITSCNKDESKPKGEYFIATIGTEKVVFNELIITLYSDSFGPPYKLLDITATSSDDSSIRISQPGYLTTQTHYERTLATDNLLAFVYHDPFYQNGNDEGGTFITGTTNDILDPGNLDITEETDKYIKGTFHFIGHNSDNLPMPVSDGSFLVYKN